jgi:phytoene synthase
LIDIIDARVFDLYDEPMSSTAALETYCRETSSVLIRLAAMILDGESAEHLGPSADHAGIAYAITGLLRALPWHAARGQVYVPDDILAAHGIGGEDVLEGKTTPAIRAALADMRALARRHLAAAYQHNVPAAIAPALLPVALSETYLRRMESRGYDPFKTPVEVPQWRRQWILWWSAHRAL